MQTRRYARWATLGAYFGLFILTLLWATVLSPPQRISTSFMLIIFVGPLLIPLRGLLYGRTRAHIWTSLLAMPYFTHGVVEGWASPAERWLAAMEIVLSIVLFVACFCYVRAGNEKTRATNTV